MTTLTKYWVNRDEVRNEVSDIARGEGWDIPIYHCADVDALVEKLAMNCQQLERENLTLSGSIASLQADLARVAAELEKAQNEIARIRMWEIRQREPDCSDIKECKP